MSPKDQALVKQLRKNGETLSELYHDRDHDSVDMPIDGELVFLAICGQDEAADRIATLNYERDSLLIRVERAEAALRPFADFAQNVDDVPTWTSNIHHESISTWFGPSDFRAARAAFPETEAK